MRTLGRVLAVAALLAFARSPAARADEALDTILMRSATPGALRAALLDFARTAPDSAAAARATALLHAGASYERAGLPDSALPCYERAMSLRGVSEDRDAYVDALLERGHAGDADKALEVLGPRLKTALTNSERDIAETKGRQAWALYTENRADSGLALMRSVQRTLFDSQTPRYRDWRYRLGLMELEHGNVNASVEAMLPLALESRFQDRDVMGILKDASRKLPPGQDLPTYMKQELAKLDAQNQAVITALGGRRVSFNARDGFLVSALVVPSARRPARAAVVLMDPEEGIDAYDSLAAGLARAGYGVALVNARGSGWSVSPVCPLPSTWRGREDELRDRVAADALPALRAMAGSTPVDTSRYVVIGALGSAAAAARAVSLDRRARPVVLLSPAPAPVERGAMSAWLSTAAVPVFFEVPIMDHETLPVVEALYEALDPRASRISESDRVGSAATVFRYDPSALPRLLTWLNESWGSQPKSTKKKGR